MYNELYEIGKHIAEMMGGDLQKLSWKAKNKSVDKSLTMRYKRYCDYVKNKSKE